MSPAELEKIKNLVVISSILSPQEKTEWLALLGLMNDKQLIELNKILSGGQLPVASTVKPVPPIVPFVSSTAKPLPVQLPKIPNVAPTITPTPTISPKLSHILNLPKVEAGHWKLEVAGKDMSQAIASPPGFLARLKAMLNEKELPPGIPANELDLVSKNVTPVHLSGQALPKSPPAAAETTANIAKPPIESQAPQSISAKWNFPNRTSVTTSAGLPTAAVKPQAPFAPKPEPAASAPDFTAQPVVKITPSVPKSVVSSQPLIKQRDDVLMSEAYTEALVTGGGKYSATVKPEKPVENFIPGLQIRQSSEQDRQANLAKIKQDLEEKPVIFSSQLVQQPEVKPAVIIEASMLEENIPPGDPPLDKLEDLPNLKVPMLQRYRLEGLIKKIKALMKKNGYYETLLALEKSQAYKDYVSTGKKLLGEQLTFEELGESPRQEAYLERHEFEKFADLLIHIQAA